MRPARTSRRPAVRAINVALTLVAALSVAGQLATAPAAYANEPVAPTPSSPVAAPSDNDGSCDTAPATYPGDGDPVPPDAGCALVLGAAGAVVGEAWSWRDLDTVHWYSYPATTAAEPAVGSIVMCGSTDPAQAGVVYDCSADSPYLLFTVSNVFVEWPAPPTGLLHYCQSVTFTGALGAVTGTACASVASRAGTEATVTSPPPVETPAPTPTPPATPPTSAPVEPAPTSAPPVPTSVPVQTETGDPPPAAETEQPAEPEPSPTQPQVSGPAAEVEPTPTAPVVAVLPAPNVDSTPLDSVSVAVVGGARFPLGFVIALAVGLALGGIVMLSAPGAAAAARRHRR